MSLKKSHKPYNVDKLTDYLHLLNNRRENLFIELDWWLTPINFHNVMSKHNGLLLIPWYIKIWSYITVTINSSSKGALFLTLRVRVTQQFSAIFFSSGHGSLALHLFYYYFQFLQIFKRLRGFQNDRIFINIFLSHLECTIILSINNGKYVMLNIKLVKKLGK